MWITEFKDYKTYLKALLKTYPKHGRGQSRRLADHLNVAAIVVSQVLARDRHFTPEQAIKVAEFFGMDARTSEYFIFLVNYARADSKELKAFYQNKLAALRTEAENIRNLVQGKTGLLSKEDQGVYYSNWYYVAVRALSALPQTQTVEALASYLGMSRADIGEIVSFLVEAGLCVQDERGKIRPGPKQIHIENKSPFVNNHRRNWRDKAKEKLSGPGNDDFFYSSVVTLSEKDAELFRKKLLQFIQDFSKQVRASPEETNRCLNIDWFKF